MNNIEKIKSDKVYQQVIKDSHGGIMYNADDKYQGEHLIKLWNDAYPSDRESAGGIVRGAIGHLMGDLN